MSEDIRDILAASKTVAVVGLSDNPNRPSYYVAAYLQAHGYRIIPVNPLVKEVLGERAYAGLRDVPVPVIAASLFRRYESRETNSYGLRLLAALRNQFGGHAVVRADKKGNS